VAELRELGRPVWARWVRVRGAAKSAAGTIDESVHVGGALVRHGDAIVLDADGVVVPQERLEHAVTAGHERAERERAKRAKLAAGSISYDPDGLRQLVEKRGRG
jgi:4-hydroxy-4-methyl-2-oxoglutarate aldolase